MKYRINEQGSAHLIIIIVLVVVVLGALGVIFWQNVVNKPAADSDNATTAQSSELTAKTLTVTEWSVKGTYKSDSTIGYELNQFGGISVIDPSQRSGCEVLGSVSQGVASDAAIVGSTSSGKTTKEAYDLGYGSARAQVGENYYLYTGPQDSCDDPDNQNKAIEAVKEFVSSLKAK